MTPEERLAKLEQLKALKAMKAQQAEEPSLLDYGKDIAAEALTATGVATEGMADMLSLPLSLGQRAQKGFANLADEDPESGFWQGAMETPPQGQATRDFFKPVTQFAKENRSVPEGENTAFDMVRTSVQQGLPIAMSGGLGKGGGLSKTLDKMASPIRHSAAGAALGAAGGEQIGGEAGEQIGSMAGSLLGDWRGMADMAKASGRSVTAVGRMIKRRLSKEGVNLDTATEKELLRSLGHYLNEAYDPTKPETSPEYIDALLRRVQAKVAAGEQGTVGQLSGDLGLRQAERRGADASRGVGQQMDAIDARIDTAAQQPMRDIAPAGAPEQAGALPRSRVRAAKDQVTQRQATSEQSAESALAQARAQSEATQTGFNSRMLNEAAPEGVVITDVGTEGGKQLKKAVQKQYGDAWASAGKPPKDVTDSMADAIESIMPQVTTEDASKFRALQADIKKLAEAGSEFSLSQLDMKIGRLQGKAANSTTVNEVLDQMRQQFRGGLTDEAQEALRLADRNYPNFLTVQKAGRSANAIGEFTPSQAATGSRGVGGNRAFTGDAPLQQTVAEGVTDAAVVKEQQKLAQQLRNKTVNQGKTKVKSQKAAIEASPTGRFANPETHQHVAAVKEAMKGGQPVKSIKQILKGTEANPQAREDIRRAFMSEFTNSVTSGKGTKKGMLTNEALDKFKLRRDVYEQSGIFSKGELDQVQKGLEEGRKVFLGVGVKDLAKLPPDRRRLLEVVAALAGAKTGALAFGSPLIGASLGRRFAKEKLAAFTTEKSRDLSYQLSVNPQKFMDIVNKLGKSPTEKEVFNFMQRLAVRAGVATAIEEKD